jgi:Right handed beta helix region
VSYRRCILAPAVALVAALALAPAAGAVDYPPPGKPTGSTGKPKGPFRTLRVCKSGHRCFPRIQDAVNEARPGDTIRVADGTWREGVKVLGSKKRYIKLIGNAKHPDKVVIEGKGLKNGSNGVLVNGADQVTINGFTAQHFRANGFFVTNAKGYTMTNLRAFLAGVYGVYAFNSVGGTISDSVAAWNSDSGFYIGQTPVQAKPVRSIVRNITSYGNVLGWSGTNMRYVTISDSKFFNNGAGVVPNALDSEKWPPAENNVITRNEVFWNNYNYYAGAPFKLGNTQVKGSVPFPVGVGILLFGGRGNQVTQNSVYGNWLVGIGALQALTLKAADARDLVGNSVTGNDFGLNGTDLNGRDLFYDGNGSGNCFGPNNGVQARFPADGSTFQDCPFTGANAFNADAQAAAVNWTVGDSTHEANWIRHDHAPKPGLTPMEHYTGGVK